MGLMQKHLDSPRGGGNGCRGEEMEGGIKGWKEKKTLKPLIVVNIEFEDKVVIFCEASLKNYE